KKERKEVKPKPAPGDDVKPWSKEWINKKLEDKRILAAVIAVIAIPVLLFLFWPSSGSAKVALATKPPGAKISVNDKETTQTTDGEFTMKPGKYKLEFSLPKYKTKKTEIEVKAGKPQKLSFDLEPDVRKVAITSKPSGATLVIDEKDSGKTDAELTLDPGKHSVRLSLSGYKTLKEEIEVEKDNQSFAFVLKAAKAEQSR